MAIAWTNETRRQPRPMLWAQIAVLVGVLLALMVGTADAQGCGSVQPGASWVCVNGGWLPPGHPDIPAAPSSTPPTPIPPTAPPIPSPTLFYGPGFPMGEIVEFVPPLRLAPSFFPDLVVDGQYQPGRQRLTVTGAGKVFRPVPTPGYTGPLVIVESLGSMTVPLLNSTATFTVQDLTIQGIDPSQPCLQVQAHSVVLERVVTTDCAGVDFRRSVDVQVIDSLFARGTRCLWLRGEGPVGLDGPNSVTHTRIASTRCEGFTGPEAILISHGIGVVFDRVIVQGNHGAAVRVQPSSGWPDARIDGVVLRDSWFESNGSGLVDPLNRVRFEGVHQSW